jgi:hypothetical protein
MRRREFYQFVGSTEAARPLAVHAQPPAGTVLLSLLYSITTMDAEACSQLSAEEERKIGAN